MWAEAVFLATLFAYLALRTFLFWEKKRGVKFCKKKREMLDKFALDFYLSAKKKLKKYFDFLLEADLKSAFFALSTETLKILAKLSEKISQLLHLAAKKMDKKSKNAGSESSPFLREVGEYKKTLKNGKNPTGF